MKKGSKLKFLNGKHCNETKYDRRMNRYTMLHGASATLLFAFSSRSTVDRVVHPCRPGVPMPAGSTTAKRPLDPALLHFFAPAQLLDRWTAN